MGRIKKSMLVVGLGGRTLKILDAGCSGRGWRINGIYAADITGRTVEGTVSLLKDALGRLQIKNRKAVLVIPRSLTAVRLLRLPASGPAELKNMLDIQAVQQIPYTREEMVYDYHIVGTSEDGYTKVFLAIVHRDNISRCMRIAGAAGLSVENAVLDSAAVIPLCSSFGGSDDTFFSGDGPVAVIDIDYASTNVSVLKSGELVFTRAVSIGAVHLAGYEHFSAEKDGFAKWIGEVNRSIGLFQKEQAEHVGRAVIFETYSESVSMIKERLEFPVSVFDIASCTEGASLREGMMVEGKNVNASFAGLIGAVREGTAPSVNLILPEVTEAKNRRLKRRALTFTGILMAGIVLTLGLTLNKKINDRMAYLKSLNRRIEKTAPLAEELAVKKERLALIRKQLSVNGSSLDILRELYSIIPPKTSLNVFTYDSEEKVMSIKGASPAMSEVFNLIPKLEASPYFKDVKSHYATKRRIKGQEITEFYIDASITVPGGENA